MRIVALGDVIFPRAPGPRGLGPRVVAELRAADLVVANLELPLTDRHDPAPKFCPLRGSPEDARTLSQWGVDVVTLANNHALDHGPRGLADTIEALAEAGVDHVGAGRDLAASLRPAIVQVRDTTVAILSVSTALPGDSAARQDRPGVAPIRVTTDYERTLHVDETPGWPARVRTSSIEDDVRAIERELQRAREMADVVLVGIHWGVPTVPWLAEYQTPLAHRLVDAGADVVVGHHPHMLHGVEYHANGVVLYSTGHFVCDAAQVSPVLEMLSGFERAQWRLGAIFDVIGERGSWRVELLPLEIDDAGWPQPASEAATRRIADTVTEMSWPFATEIAAEADRVVATPRRGGRDRAGVG